MSANLKLWGVFCTATQKSAQALLQASKTSLLETGRATAGTGLVFLGFFTYDNAKKPFKPQQQETQSAEEIKRKPNH